MFVCVHQQRDSGDDEDMDKNSEDEEGQLEEQIERLQEKVESAQSEQKNLFLVIFQVLRPQTFPVRRLPIKRIAEGLKDCTLVNVVFPPSAFHHVVDGASGSLRDRQR